MFFGARRGSVVQLLLPVTTPYTASGRIVRSRRVKWMILLMSTMGLIVCGMKSSFHSSGRHKVARFQFDNHHVWQSTNNNSLPKPIVVLPATQTNPKFCRTLFSLLINGYNPPIILNWDKTLYQEKTHGAYTRIFPWPRIRKPSKSNHYNKVEGMLSWLHGRQGSPSDVILMLDGYDVWAQLPASFVYAQHSSYPFRSDPGVIVGAEKNCWPFSRRDPQCRDLPESPLPRDVYGEETDKYHAKIPENSRPALSKDAIYEYGPLDTIRPRFLNSGTVIGTSHDLTSVFTKMSVKLELVEKGQLTPKHRGSDQELMARVNLDSMKKGGPQAVLGDDQMMLFQVVTFSYKDLIFQTVVETIPDTKEAQHEPLRNLLREEAQWANRSIAYNHISHTIPPLLHFPGPRKPKNWWKLMWWMQPLKHSNCTSPQCLKQERTPAELFYAILESRTDEASGYGAKLPDGTWLSYMDLCGPFKQTMLK